MREIKFRAWDTSCGNPSMLEWKDLQKYTVDCVFLPANMEVNLMQYTGLKDKNGKEIYEGDIARYYMDSRWKYGQVKAGRGGWEFHVYKMGNEVIKRIFKFQTFIPTPQYDFMDNTMQDEFEIIGNIYENPELLNGG